jgi:Fur family transcriptional regulator, ferric uptake regulator
MARIMQPKTSRRMTEQRRVILEELKKVTCHPTADELHSFVRKRLPKISIATVYRNLEILSSDGLVLKLDVAGTRKRFDGTTDSHCHIRCCVCGKVDDISVDPMPLIDDMARKVCSYEVLSHTIEFTGICPECGGNDCYSNAR